MKILFWNARGLGLKEKRSKVKKLVKDHRIDMMLIQETKQKEITKKFIVSIWGDGDCDYIEVDAEGSTTGLLII